jgi:general L-amino acid transport system substrate-binding protein
MIMRQNYLRLLFMDRLLTACRRGLVEGHEIFERNVGKASPLKLDRGLNATWSKGGLMYAIPFK